MLDDWTDCLDTGGQIGQIDARDSDFEKAFDRVLHRRLISKLHSYKITTEIVDWIVDFLRARKFRVRVNGIYSMWQNVTSAPFRAVCGAYFYF